MTRQHIYIILANILLALLSLCIYAASVFVLAFHDAPGSMQTTEYAIDSLAVFMLPFSNIIAIVASQILYLRGKDAIALSLAIFLPLLNLLPLIYFYGPLLVFGPQLIWMVMTGR